jgi:hypothetical protein
MQVTSATWIDTQRTSRQRRADCVLDVQTDGQRRIEHTEWQLRWEADLPFRLFEYHVLLALDVNDEVEGDDPPPIRSTLVLLSGRNKKWPTRGVYRTSPPGEPFTGVTFRIDAVYQRTVAELSARGSPFWLVFAPLAVDADARAMERVVATLQDGQDERRFAELAVALTVMADADKRRRGLRNAIIPLLKKEIVMESWVFKQGRVEGRAEGRAEGEARGKADAVLVVLKGRGIPVSGDARGRILACTDTAQLDVWLERALAAASVADVFDSR